MANEIPYSGVVDELTLTREPDSVITVPGPVVVSDGRHEVRLGGRWFDKVGEEEAVKSARIALSSWAQKCAGGKCGIHSRD